MQNRNAEVHIQISDVDRVRAAGFETAVRIKSGGNLRVRGKCLQKARSRGKSNSQHNELRFVWTDCA